MADELDRVLGTLHGGSTPPAGPPTGPPSDASPVAAPSPTPQETPRETHGGFSLPKTAPPPADATPDAEQRIARLEQELEQAKKRHSDAASAMHKNADELTLQKAVVEALQRVRREEMDLYNRQAGMQPPEINLEELHEKPEAIRDAILNAVTWGRNTVLASLVPELQKIAQRLPELDGHAAVAERLARKEAKESVQEQFGFSDFDDLWDDVREMISGQPNSSVMLSDPEVLADAYMIARRRKGLPMVGARESSPPPSLPNSPDVNRRSPASAELKERMTRLSPYAAEVAKRLGMDALKIDSVEDLDRAFANNGG